MWSLRRFIVLFIALLGLARVAKATDIKRLITYECVLEKYNDRSAIIGVTMRTSQGISQFPDTIALRADKKVLITDLDLKNGSYLLKVRNFDVRANGGRLPIAFTSSEPVLLRYKVTSKDGDLSRFPLPVPLIMPATGGADVHIILRLSPTEAIFGDTFPSFTEIQPGEWRGELTSVPSVILFRSKAKVDISWRERFLTTAWFADLGMLALVILSVTALYLRYRIRSNSIEKLWD